MKLRLAFSMIFIAGILSACNLPVSVNTVVPEVTLDFPIQPRDPAHRHPAGRYPAWR